MKSTRQENMINTQLEPFLNRPIAHRGRHDNNHLIPENSIPAFQRAVREGYPVELDVRLLKSGEVAVFHDVGLKRMCGIDTQLSALARSDLGTATLGNTSEKIPLLRDVLDSIDGVVPLLVEIKSEGRAGQLEENTAALLKSYRGPVAIQSFNPLSVAWFASRMPIIPRGQLSAGFKGEKMSLLTKFVLRNFLLNFKSCPHFIAYEAEDMPNRRMQRFRKKGLPVLCWTVRSMEQYRSLQPFCDNIIFENFNP